MCVWFPSPVPTPHKVGGVPIQERTEWLPEELDKPHLIYQGDVQVRSECLGLRQNFSFRLDLGPCTFQYWEHVQFSVRAISALTFLGAWQGEVTSFSQLHGIFSHHENALMFPFRGCLCTSEVHFTHESFSFVGVSMWLVFKTWFCDRNHSPLFMTH